MCSCVETMMLQRSYKCKKYDGWAGHVVRVNDRPTKQGLSERTTTKKE